MGKYYRDISRKEMKQYGESFRLMRESAGMTLTELAAEINVDRTMLSRWEKGLQIPQEDIWEIKERIKEVTENRILTDEYLYKKYKFVHEIYKSIELIY